MLIILIPLINGVISFHFNFLSVCSLPSLLNHPPAYRQARVGVFFFFLESRPELMHVHKSNVNSSLPSIAFSFSPLLLMSLLGNLLYVHQHKFPKEANRGKTIIHDCSAGGRARLDYLASLSFRPAWRYACTCGSSCGLLLLPGDVEVLFLSLLPRRGDCVTFLFLLPRTRGLLTCRIRHCAIPGRRRRGMCPSRRGNSG